VRSIRLAVIAGLVVGATASVAAQSTYPEGTIRLLFGFPAGNDIIARIYADKLADVFGHSVLVDNITGAAGNIAADRTAKAIPDGYTIGMLASANIVINLTLYKRLPYDPVKDLIPIAQVYKYPNVLLVNNDVPAKSVAELIALARARPGKLTYGHSGAGTTTHLSAELLKSMGHIDIQDVPYRGPSAVLTDLMSGRITMAFNTPSVSLPLIRENKVRALAVTSRTRAPFAPNLVTMEESGFPEFETIVWFGLFAPAGTPAFIIDRLNRETAIIMSSLEVQRKVLDLGQVPIGNTQAEFAAIIKAEIPYWARLITAAGIKQVE
jgi:tripartite-type tricarboxylate transporter receptor subunit TctC